jgi:hypothetical protein
VSDDVGAGDRGSYGPKWALVLNEFVQKQGSEVADRLVMTSAEQSRDLDRETARICASGRILRLQGEDHGEAKREATAQVGGVRAGCFGHRYWRGVDLRRGTTGSCCKVDQLGLNVNFHLHIDISVGRGKHRART